MAVNLGQRLRDAVDGPGVDAVLGEDPAGFDLPALSARIRRRRRTRAGVTSAVGVAAAGAVAIAGVHGVGRGGTDAEPPAASTAANLCGTDAGALPVADDGLWLVSPDTSVVPTAAGGVEVVPGGPDLRPETSGVGSLGVLSGRRLVTTLVEGDSAADPVTGATVALSQGGDVVAIGSVEAVTTGVLVGPSGIVSDEDAGWQQVFRATGIAADLVSCGDPAAPLAAGSYAVQLVVPGADGLRRTTAGPWLVRLLNPSVPATLPGYPSDEVPVIGGDAQVESADLSGATGDGLVLVATTSVDAVSFAADALRAAGAQVTMGDALVVDDIAAGAEARAAATDETARLQQAVTDATAALTEAHARADELAGEPDRLQERVEAMTAVEAAQNAVMQAMENLADATQRAMQRETTSHGAYRFREPSSFTATTEHWKVTVTYSPGLLNYQLTAR